MDDPVSGELSSKDTRLTFEVEREKELGLEDKMIAKMTTDLGCEFGLL